MYAECSILCGGGFLHEEVVFACGQVVVAAKAVYTVVCGAGICQISTHAGIGFVGGCQSQVVEGR